MSGGVCVQQRLLFVCPVWKPKTLNVSQLGSNLHVTFEQAPPSFGFTLYYLYYKLRQDGPFKLQRCKPVRARLLVSVLTCAEEDTLATTQLRQQFLNRGVVFTRLWFKMDKTGDDSEPASWLV